MLTTLFNVAFGFALGWLVFERPDVATQLINRAREFFSNLGSK